MAKEKNPKSIPKIPFSFLPPKLVSNIAGKLENLGGVASALFPTLRETLLQAEIETAAPRYASLAIAAGLANAAFVGILLAALGLIFRQSVATVVAALTAIVAIVTFTTILIYPGIVARRRARAMDAFLIPATRQLLIEVKSGVPLFNAMASVSDEYGGVSQEFRKMVKKINSGVPEIDVITEATMTNPSLHFRKLLWQISNSLKVGSDVAKVLETQIDEMMRLKVQQIRNYGQELSPWTMIYMMAAVILPSLGITMLIVVGSFVNFVIPKVLLVGILIFLLLFQLFFMNFVASRRPAI
ncbi:type II secretion system F family protein [Candidatus Micrarchaeota archaeon]|nr:type II secretion system F family protein [Candidatus Micrarchaeota archaeon]